MSGGAWWLLEMEPDPESGLARPTLGGSPIPSQAAVEVLVGGAAVAGRLVLNPGARSQLSVTFSTPKGLSTGQMTTLLLPTSGVYLRPTTAGRLPLTQVAPHEVPPDPEPEPELEATAEELEELAAALETAGDPGPRAMVRNDDGEWEPLPSLEIPE